MTLCKILIDIPYTGTMVDISLGKAWYIPVNSYQWKCNDGDHPRVALMVWTEPIAPLFPHCILECCQQASASILDDRDCQDEVHLDLKKNWSRNKSLLHLSSVSPIKSMIMLIFSAEGQGRSCNFLFWLWWKWNLSYLLWIAHPVEL